MQTEGKLSFCFLKAHTQNDAFLLLVMALLDSVMWLCIILLSLLFVTLSFKCDTPVSDCLCRLGIGEKAALVDL